jgi:hypothetical protein
MVSWAYVLGEGFLYLQPGKEGIRTSDKRPPDDWFCIPCDETLLAHIILGNAINSTDEYANNDYRLTQNMIDYIKTIDRFKCGKFYFKGETNDNFEKIKLGYTGKTSIEKSHGIKPGDVINLKTATFAGVFIYKGDGIFIDASDDKETEHLKDINEGENNNAISTR